MRTTNAVAIAIHGVALIALLGAAGRAGAQDATPPYSRMAPIEQYFMEPSAEIALARTAAPASISSNAEVLVLGQHGFEPAVKGTNGFVCIVERSWTGAPDADFWNPKVRVPICYNAAAARTYLPRNVEATRLILAGRTKAQVEQAIIAATDDQLPPVAPGAMCYMLSKEGFGGDSIPHWPPHLMFFYSNTDPATWGAGLPGSPVLASSDPRERLTTFAVAVSRWSDGTEGR
ncbi:MAG TPA: hypothetical protein VF737_09950 [Gemmatimonadaceae bacterium]